MIEFIKDHHTAIISGMSNCGKTFFVMNLLLTEYLNHFEIVVVICPTFNNNRTYQDNIKLFTRDVKSDITSFVYSTNYDIESEVTRYSDIYSGKKILFILDDILACEGIVKRRSSLTELACSGRHTSRSLWILTQKYNSISKILREQSSWVCSFECKDLDSYTTMIKENFSYKNCIDIKDSYIFLESHDRSKLLIRNKFPKDYCLLSI